ncbi:hypothetical protein CBR_g3578 [Chara braunii]|uniref:Uncharacterized protein n=1 Tax=Chara braunii TaxID=69332 RepID=A0A388KFP5_CHABU|nr:hypothetical protein CBR_g3578 [Chara braunii]|eukprot:GBG68880.1 hypothetical protein CBR_g3578 [Chara braunii]
MMRSCERVAKTGDKIAVRVRGQRGGDQDPRGEGRGFRARSQWGEEGGSHEKSGLRRSGSQSKGGWSHLKPKDGGGVRGQGGGKLESGSRGKGGVREKPGCGGGRQEGGGTRRGEEGGAAGSGRWGAELGLPEGSGGWEVGIARGWEQSRNKEAEQSKGAAGGWGVGIRGGTESGGRGVMGRRDDEESGIRITRGIGVARREEGCGVGIRGELWGDGMTRGTASRSQEGSGSQGMRRDRGAEIGKNGESGSGGGVEELGSMGNRDHKGDRIGIAEGTGARGKKGLRNLRDGEGSGGEQSREDKEDGGLGSRCRAEKRWGVGIRGGIGKMRNIGKRYREGSRIRIEQGSGSQGKEGLRKREDGEGGRGNGSRGRERDNS